MIRYTCSGCGKSLKAPPSYAGKVGTCPRCKRPAPVPTSSAEGSPEEPLDLGEEPRPAPRPGSDPDDSEELFLRRRRKRSALPLVALLGLLLLVGLTAVAALFVFAMRSERQRDAEVVAVTEARDAQTRKSTEVVPGRDLIAAPPRVPLPAGNERDQWTHKELADYLAGRGLQLEWAATHHGALHGPAAYFYRPGTPEAGTERMDFRTPGTVYVQKRKSEGDARDEAAVHKENAFAWGRFLFASTDQKLLGEIRQALTPRP
ncbi:MAG TPA: hypothetical protein VKE74_33925 [Gemmataceae bacterium]|nr:hypothetical protein [Gemmataceae bacterium]